MICEICGGDYPHGGGVDHCLTYGGRVMCFSCMIRQPVCVDCNRHRHGAFMIDGRCEECHQLHTLVVLQQQAVPPPLTNTVGEVRVQRAPTTAADLRDARGQTMFLDDPPVRLKVEGQPPSKMKSGRCDFCGDYDTRLHTLRTGHNACNFCVHEAGTCGYCEEVRLLKNGACRECSKENPRGIEHNWRYRPPRFKKWGYSEDKLYFGIENEVECTIPKARYLKNISRSYFFDEAYTMHDGTIDYGTEVVMHPRTFESLKKFNFEPMLEGVKPHKNTGMHVHLSREAFSNRMHLYKFMRFFVKNKGFIEFIAERRSKLFRAWEFTDREQVIAKCKGREVGEGKYIDVNLRHHETIEVRIFKGATTPEQIMKNVEFCHALWKFSKEYLPKKMTRFQFERWLKEQSDYPNLSEFVEGRNS